MGLFGTACMFSPLLTYVSRWFERRRGSAVALISSGQSVAGAIWPPLLQLGIDDDRLAPDHDALRACFVVVGV